MSRLGVLPVVCLSAFFAAASVEADAPDERPNFVIIFTDDQGYGDLGCYGATEFRTPRIDQLADEGTRFTSFYAQVVCGPSRSALLTGRYPVRSHGWSMPASEITIAELLQQAGYRTGCIGKWDVSNRAAIPDRMPNAQGFDEYFGTLGANDSGRVRFHRNQEPAGTTDDMGRLTERYTDEAIRFLESNQDRPFFLYLAHTMVHSVIGASDAFRGRSAGGLYGDCIEELDFHTGRLLDAIDELGLRENTLILFTTDNGPWNNLQEVLRRRHDGAVAWGSSGPLRAGKGSTYEGGLRVPCIARWPNRIPAGRTSDAIFATIDLLPTLASLGGCELPADRIIDGVDQTALLRGESDAGARDNFLYFCQGELHAVRRGPWKVILPDRQRFYGYVKDRGSQNAELYHLIDDVGEMHDLADEQPERVAELLRWSSQLALPQDACDPRIGRPRDREANDSPQNGPSAAANWEAHGFTEEQRVRIRSHFRSALEERILPGGTLRLIHRGEVIFDEAYGRIDADGQQPFRTDTPCRIASLSKPFTATLIVGLAADGRVSLDVPIDEYLPEFRGIRVRPRADEPQGRSASRAPTLRECLSHTAGFPGNRALKSGAIPLQRDGSLADAVTELAAYGLIAEPGRRYAYSRLGYMTAGRVAEVVTGRTFPRLLRLRLLDPLGAETATFAPSADLQARLPLPVDRTAGGFRPRVFDMADRTINPGGGLVAGSDDVSRLLLLHRNRGRHGDRQLIPGDRLRDMYDPRPATPGSGYGLGFNIMQRRADGSPSRIRHTGASGTLGVIDFDRDLIIILLTQVPQTQTRGWRSRLLRTITDIVPPHGDAADHGDASAAPEPDTDEQDSAPGDRNADARPTDDQAANDQAAGRAGPRPSASRQRRQRGVRVPEGVTVDRDLPYAATDNPRQTLDLLLPQTRTVDGPLPIVVFIHGGGWRQGQKAAGLRPLSALVRTGRYAGATIGYRLSGESQWPSQIHDCKAAIRWLRANASRWDLDGDRIAVWGTSAGGHLAAMLGTSAGVADMDGSLGPHTQQSTRVTCVVDFFGPTDFLTMNAMAPPGARLDHDAADSPESLLIGGAIQEHPDRVKSANPVTYASSDDPPLLMIHGTDDPLVPFPQSERLRDALQEHGGDVTLIPVQGGGHGGFRNPRVDRTVEAFLSRYLLGRDVEIDDSPIPDRPSASGDI